MDVTDCANPQLAKQAKEVARQKLLQWQQDLRAAVHFEDEKPPADESSAEPSKMLARLKDPDGRGGAVLRGPSLQNLKLPPHIGEQ